MNSNTISICIPTYEMRGKGADFLNHSFKKLHEQTYKNFNIIISDHSESTMIEDLCNVWKEKLNIKYFINNNKRGNSSSNLNNCINLANNKIIKILFQDDFLFDENSLQVQLNKFIENNAEWLVTASFHTKDCVNFTQPYYPRYNNNIQYGDNTISSPSVLMFKKTNTIQFDENLIWLMDCDFYKRMFDAYGLPVICDNITVVNREHPDQITKIIVNDAVKTKEHIYILKKYEK